MLEHREKYIDLDEDYVETRWYNICNIFTADTSGMDPKNQPSCTGGWSASSSGEFSNISSFHNFLNPQLVSSLK